MSTSWPALLCRVLDEDFLTAEEAQELATAIEKPENRREARGWLLFEAVLRGLLSPARPALIAASKERLLARAVAGRFPGVASRPVARGIRLALAGTLTALVVVLGWIAVGGYYPPPEVKGDFFVTDREAVGRGAEVVTRNTPAVLSLGGYCCVGLQPQTRLRIGGAKGAEEIFLFEGEVRCLIIPDCGDFTVHTDRGSLSVTDGEFVIRLVADEIGSKTVSPRMYVKLVSGNGNLRGPGGYQVLSSGMEAWLPGTRD